jgi:hypothetical protein
MAHASLELFGPNAEHSLVNQHARLWRRCLRYVPAALLLVIICGIGASEWHQISKQRMGAFATYYGAASALRQGHSPYGRLHGYPYVYPPFFAFVCQPLTLFSYDTATRTMLALDGLIILAALVAGARAVHTRLEENPAWARTFMIALLAAAITGVPIFRELRTLQVNGILLLGFALGLLWLDRHPTWAGLALATAISIKYLPIIALPYLLLRRRWAAGAAVVIGIVGLGLLPALTLGWSTNLHDLAIAQRGLFHAADADVTAASTAAAHVHSLTDPLNISVTSSLARLAASCGWPQWTAIVMTLCVAVIWFAGVLAVYRRERLPLLRWPSATGQAADPFHRAVALEWAGLVTAAIAFSPNGELIFAALPACVVAALLRSSRSIAAGWLPAVIALMMWAAVTLPISAIGHLQTHQWNAVAAPCWILLAMYPVILLAREQRAATPPR